ncbi:MAG TPA: hypothetical protein VLW47_06965 [Thermodesulfobacteriota bacterium]|nr:hypothetical protein [Thermodesulfobacteriota bacterium]
MESQTIADKNNWSPYLKAIYDNSSNNKIEDDFFGTEKEDNSLAPFPNEAAHNPIDESCEKGPPKKEDTPFMSSFLPELIQSIKSTLISIKNTSSLSTDKFNDPEFRKHAQQSIREDIKRIDSVLNNLLNYININTPITKSNTISLILDEVLEANEKQILSKKIKITKKCERDLPETFIHDEQVRFILNALLQYSILSTPVDGSIGFLLNSFDFQNGGSDGKISPERSGSYIEAAIGFTGSKISAEPSKEIPSSPPAQKDETVKLILELVKETLQKSHGSMTHEVDPKKPRTLITLRFPIERRKVIYYEPISI